MSSSRGIDAISVCYILSCLLSKQEQHSRVATVREKYLENDFFPGQGKVGEFCGWPGKFRKDLESQGKVREFENKWQA